jgi:membrane protease YdiL (CAAX protease family)
MWIILESALYAIVVAMLVSGVVGLLFAFFAQGTITERAPGYFQLLALSIGAGIYEELIFRVILVGGIYLLIRTFFRDGAYATAALIGAVIFSAVHYTGPLGDPFTLASFTFRFLFGLALNVLFLWRGFAVAAWTHALYDVFVVTRGVV